MCFNKARHTSEIFYCKISDGVFMTVRHVDQCNTVKNQKELLESTVAIL